MKTITILRTSTDDHGTFGVIWTPDGEALRTLELPHRDNKINISCIPAGEYIVEWLYSEKFGHSYKVKNVPGRSHILFHAANFAGDVEKGYNSHLKGCITLGQFSGMLGGQKAVINSKKALETFKTSLKKKDFKLIIKELYRR